MLNPSEAFEIVVVVVGVILVLKRIINIDEYHITRVVILTAILGFGAILLLSGLAAEFGGFGPHSCVVEFDAPVEHY